MNSFRYTDARSSASQYFRNFIVFAAFSASVYSLSFDAPAGSSAGNSMLSVSSLGNSWELYRTPLARPAWEPPKTVFVFVFVFVFVLLAPRRLMVSPSVERGKS